MRWASWNRGQASLAAGVREELTLRTQVTKFRKDAFG